MTHPPTLPNGFSRDFSEVRDALKSAIRAAKMAMFIHDRREHPNDNWRHGINADLAVAEKMVAEMGAPVQAPVHHQYRAGELIIDIDCQTQAKSVGWEASPTTTATGVRWVIKGALAAALIAFRDAPIPTPGDAVLKELAEEGK